MIHIVFNTADIAALEAAIELDETLSGKIIEIKDDYAVGPLLDIYEKVRASTGGIGAAALIGDKCGGCNLTINAVEMNRIKALAMDELLRCEECRRILVRV